MAKKDLSYDQLLNQNRILKRQNGTLKADMKVDIKKLRSDSLKEGYNTAVKQLQPEIDLLHDEIERLQNRLQEEGILY